MNIGAAKLRKWRGKRSQRDAAFLCNLSQATLSELETSKAVPQLATALRIAKVTKGAVPVESWTKEPTP